MLHGSTPPPRVEEPDADPRSIPESVLHSLWSQQRFEASRLLTHQRQAIQVLAPGRLNTDAGPDFLEATLRIREHGKWLEWTGDVELHRSSSQWIQHKHHVDPRYNRVVLHVILEPDARTGSLLRQDGTSLPEAALYPCLTEPLRESLYRFVRSPDESFPCAPLFEAVHPDIRRDWVRSLALDRLQEKAERWRPIVDSVGLDEALYQAILECLGYAKNNVAMRALAEHQPLARLRTLDSPLDIEALLFGTAGLIPDPAQEQDQESAAYVHELRSRFHRLADHLEPLEFSTETWTFFRLRPANFPTRRIAQAAAMLHPDGLFRTGGFDAFRAALTSSNPINAGIHLLQQTRPGPYWTRHYRFGTTTSPTSTVLGRSRCHRILLDAVSPLLYLASPSYNAAMDILREWLSHLPALDDEIVRLYSNRGYAVRDAIDGWGLHHLNRRYCSAMRCLSCRIGDHVLSA